MKNSTIEKIEFLLVILCVSIIALFPIFFNNSYSKLIEPLLNGGTEFKFLFLLHIFSLSLVVVFIFHIKEKIELEKESKKYNEKLEETVIKENGEIYKYVPFQFIHRTIRSLNKSIIRYDTIGRVSLIITVFTMIVVGAFVFNIFEHVLKDAQQLQNMNNGNIILSIIIVILRTSLLGSFIITFTIYSYKFSSASFDQAVRFTKRKHASLFLLEMLDNLEFDKSTSIQDIMSSFKEWNVNVESAFTDIKNQDKTQQYVFDRIAKIDEMLLSKLSMDNKSSVSSGEKKSEGES